MKIEVKNEEVSKNEWKKHYPHIGLINSGHCENSVVLFLYPGSVGETSNGVILKAIYDGVENTDVVQKEFFRANYRKFDGEITLRND